MYKLIHNIETCCRRCVVIVLILCASAGAFAQDEDSTEGIYLETPPEVTTANEKVKQFDPVTDASKITIQQRKVSESNLKKIKEEKDFWYVNEAPPRRAKAKPVSEPRPSKVINTTWFRNLLWMLVVGGFIAILIWFLLSSNVQLFQKKQTKIAQEKDELSTDNIFDINYEMEIAKAAAARDFRLAIRLLYLQILKELSQKGILQYKQERTNSDYVLQLFGTAYYKDFFALTRSFEYSWYGQFPISEEAFKTIHIHFSTFKQGLP